MRELKTEDKEKEMRERHSPFSILHSDSRGGFSLFEIILSIAIFSGILFAVTSFRGNLNTLNNFVSQRLQSRQDIEQTMQIMVSEIRSAGPSSLGGYAIESATSTSFVFYSDIDKDGLFERVRYFTGTSTVQKGVIKPAGNPLVYASSSETISSVVNNLTLTSTTPLFTYYDSYYTGSQAPMTYPINVQGVRIVKVSLYADVNTSSTPKPEFFSNTITIRNLRSN